MILYEASWWLSRGALDAAKTPGCAPPRTFDSGRAAYRCPTGARAACVADPPRAWALRLVPKQSKISRVNAQRTHDYYVALVAAVVRFAGFKVSDRSLI
jgi:hypothetical protein